MSQRALVVWTITSRKLHAKADRVLEASELEEAMLEAVTALGFARQKEFDAGLELPLDASREGGLDGLRREIYSAFVQAIRARGHDDALARDAFSRAYVTLYRFDERSG